MELGIGGLGYATEIGTGASAVVYRARQLDLDREVAVKVLSVTDEAFVRRFAREAKMLGKLSQNPGIVTVYDTGVTATGHPYLILELCQSSILDRIQGPDGPFEPIEACRAGAQVADAVSEAHTNGVIHRDIKPGNVLASQTGRYMITDFGISTVTGATTGHTNSVGFTAGYVAPETLSGETAGTPADIYALGATLFHMIAGKAPFVDVEQHSNLLALAQRVINDPVPDLRPQGVPDEVCRIIEGAMAKRPQDRPTAAQLRDQLQSVVADLTGGTVSATTRASAMAPLAGVATAGSETLSNQATEITPPAQTGSVAKVRTDQTSVHAEPPVADAPAGVLDGGPGAPQPHDTPPVEPYMYGDTAERRLLGPLLAGAFVGLVVLIAVGAFLVAGSDDPTEVAAATEAETVEGPTSSIEAAGNGSTAQDGSGNRSTLDFNAPGETTILGDDPTSFIVPSVTGETTAEARSKLTRLGFVVSVVEEESSMTPGRVIRQIPAAEAERAEGAIVTLFVAAASTAETVTVPSVTGQTEATARADLSGAGLSVAATVTTESHPSITEGSVIRSRPAGGTTAEEGSTVSLVISDGPAPTRCADVAGLSQSAATSRFEASGFTVIATKRTSETVAAGDVISCTQSDTTANLVVSLGGDPCPGVVGTNRAAAKTALDAVGLSVTESGSASSTAPVDEVLTCNVTAGSAAITYSTGPAAPTDCDAAEGRTVSEARTLLENQGIAEVTTAAASSPTVAAGTVISCALSNGTANLTVSSGPALPMVPNVLGKDQRSATADLRSAGLALEQVVGVDSNEPEGVVVDTEPAVGVTVAPGTKVTLVLSTGNPPAARVGVPQLEGLTRSEASLAVAEAGLRAIFQDRVVGAGGENLGRVIAVNPVAGTKVDEGSAITVTIAVASR